MPKTRPRVLIIDDEPAILAVYPEVLGVDYQVEVASSGQQALEILAREPDFDVILCDYMTCNAPRPICWIGWCSAAAVSSVSARESSLHRSRILCSKSRSRSIACVRRSMGSRNGPDL
jgi:DNA-binding NarL/FixJ family response regulator